jgi:hypothetical protein
MIHILGYCSENFSNKIALISKCLYSDVNYYFFATGNLPGVIKQEGNMKYTIGAKANERF